MKAYIEKDIIIKNQDCDSGDWEGLCKLFNKFEKEFTIFNSCEKDTIKIIPQKIVLCEENMASFLSTLQEISFCYGALINTDWQLWRYNCETDRITVDITVQDSLTDVL